MITTRPGTMFILFSLIISFVIDGQEVMSDGDYSNGRRAGNRGDEEGYLAEQADYVAEQPDENEDYYITARVGYQLEVMEGDLGCTSSK